MEREGSSVNRMHRVGERGAQHEIKTPETGSIQALLASKGQVLGEVLGTGLSQLPTSPGGILPRPPVEGSTNAQLADLARSALDYLATLVDPECSTYSTREFTEDLLTGLMHLAERGGMDFDACLLSARRNYRIDASECEFAPISPERLVELAEQAFCGLHPRLWQVMKAGASEGHVAKVDPPSIEQAKAWTEALSDDQISAAMAGWKGSQIERYMDEEGLRNSFFDIGRSIDLEGLAKGAVQEILVHIHTELDSEVVAVGFEHDVWNNDDGTAVDSVNIAFGVADDESLEGVFWTEWDNVAVIKDQLRFKAFLEEVGSWLVNSHNPSVKITLPESQAGGAK